MTIVCQASVSDQLLTFANKLCLVDGHDESEGILKNTTGNVAILNEMEISGKFENAWKIQFLVRISECDPMIVTATLTRNKGKP